MANSDHLPSLLVSTQHLNLLDVAFDRQISDLRSLFPTEQQLTAFLFVEGLRDAVFTGHHLSERPVATAVKVRTTTQTPSHN
jgi:hypothetical protein